MCLGYGNYEWLYTTSSNSGVPSAASVLRSAFIPESDHRVFRVILK